MTSKMSHQEWLDKQKHAKESKKHEARELARMEKVRKQQQKQDAERKFKAWCSRKETYDRAISLMRRCDELRCTREDDWFEMAVALAAVDLAQLREAAEADTLDDKQAVKSLMDEWTTWTKDHHQFDDIAISEKMAAKFTQGNRNRMKECAEDRRLESQGIHYMQASLKFSKPKKHENAARQKQLNDPDTAKYNAMFMRRVRKKWKAAQVTVLTRMDQMAREMASGGGEAKADDGAAGDENVAPRRPGGESQARYEKRALFRMGLKKLATWVEHDEEEALEIKRRKETSGRDEAEKQHKGFNKVKNRMRVRLPPRWGEEREAPRMDFSGKGLVRDTHGKKKQCSLDLAPVGAKYIFALPNAGDKSAFPSNDLRACRERLLELGHVFRENFTDVNGDVQEDAYRRAKEDAKDLGAAAKKEADEQQQELAREQYDAWFRRKELSNLAKKYLTAVDRPGAGDEQGDTAIWLHVGESLKKVDGEAMLGPWVHWSAGFRTAGECKREWAELEPVFKAVAPAVAMDALRRMGRRDIDFEQVFEEALEKKYKKSLRKQGLHPVDDFSAADFKKMSKHGELTKKEFQAVMKTFGVLLQPGELTQLVEVFDEDKSGTISRDEFCGFMNEKRWKAKADSHIDEKLRQEGLDALEKLSKGNREKRAQIRERSEGVAPDAPVLKVAPMEGAAEEDRNSTLRLQWHPAKGSEHVAFYVLESAGAEGGRNHRNHTFTELFRDPQSGTGGRAGDKLLEYLDTNLSPNTRYFYRIRAFNGFGPSAYTYASFATAGMAPPAPFATRITPTTVTLSWAQSAEFNRRLKQMKELFTALDRDASGELSRDEWEQGIESNASLKKWLDGIQGDAGGSIFDEIESNDDGGLSWKEFKAYVIAVGLDEDEGAAKGDGSTKYMLTVCASDEDVDGRGVGALDDRSPASMVSAILKDSEWFQGLVAKDMGRSARIDLPPLRYVQCPGSEDTATRAGAGDDPDADPTPRLLVVVDGSAKTLHTAEAGTAAPAGVTMPEPVGLFDGPVEALEVHEVCYIGNDLGTTVVGLDPGVSYQFRVQEINVGPVGGSKSGGGEGKQSDRAAALRKSRDGGGNAMRRSGAGSVGSRGGGGGEGERQAASRLSRPAVINMPLKLPGPPRLPRPKGAKKGKKGKDKRRPSAASAASAGVETGAVTEESVTLAWDRAAHVEAENKTDARGGDWTKVLDEWQTKPGAEVGGGVGDATVRKMFKKYDRDQSGEIDSHELRELFRDLGVPTSGADFEQAVSELDTDRSGSVNFEEFRAWWHLGSVTYVLKHDKGVPDSELPKVTASAAAFRRTHGVDRQGANNTRRKHSEEKEGKSGDAKPRRKPISYTEVAYRGPGRKRRIAGLKPNTLYSFRVRHVGHKSCSALGKSLRVMTAPAVPTQPAVVEAGPTWVKLKWYAGTGGAAKFEVEGMLKECLGKGPAHNVGEWKAVYSGRVGCAVVPNLTPDCDYHFRVRAFNRDDTPGHKSMATNALTMRKEEFLPVTVKNAANVFTVMCTEDVVVGDTILFQEKVYSKTGSADSKGKRGRKGSRRPSAADADGTDPFAVCERTVAAQVVGEAPGGKRIGARVLSMEVMFTTVSKKDCDQYKIKPGVKISRSEREVFKFETHRARWVQEDARWSAAEEREALQGGLQVRQGV